jgi:hypothetical protein
MALDRAARGDADRAPADLAALREKIGETH